MNSIISRRIGIAIVDVFENPQSPRPRITDPTVEATFGFFDEKLRTIRPTFAKNKGLLNVRSRIVHIAFGVINLIFEVFVIDFYRCFSNIVADDEGSQEDPNADWLDFDFGASATSRSDDKHSPSTPIADDEEIPNDWPNSDEAESDPSSVSNSPLLARAAASALSFRITTGAALLSATDSAACSAAIFAVGQTVRHPRYGIGQVIEVSRVMKRQTVVVKFEQDDRTETFVSDKCPLTLIGLN